MRNYYTIMADLNELEEFEKNLKDMICSRNNFQPTYAHREPISFDNKYNNNYAMCQEKLQPSIRTLMSINEHGRPFDSNKYLTFNSEVKDHELDDWMKSLPKCKSNITMTMYMGSFEHGQPYKDHARNMNIEDNVNKTSSRNASVKDRGMPFSLNNPFGLFK